MDRCEHVDVTSEPDQRSQRIVLARHAETEWSITGRHTGRTDIALTEAGRDAAIALGKRLEGFRFDRVISSPLTRARTTAELAGYADPEIDDNLLEWDYGDYEGVTTPDIRAMEPGWELWTDGAPNGESPDDLAARADAAVQHAVGSASPGATRSCSATATCSRRWQSAGSVCRSHTASTSASRRGRSASSAGSASTACSISGMTGHT